MSKTTTPRLTYKEKAKAKKARTDAAFRLCAKLEKSGYTAADFTALKEAARMHAFWIREATSDEKASP